VINHALAGAAGFLLLTLIEWVDTNIQLTGIFESLAERIVFSAYLSLNVLVGALVGIIVGITAWAVRRAGTGLLAFPDKAPATRNLIRLLAGLAAVVSSGVLLNWQPRAHRYFAGMLREAEKIELLRDPLLNHERSSAYLLSIGLVLACSLIWIVTSRSRNWSRGVRIAWLSALLGGIGFCYYVDSRVQVQLYENTLHSSMYLLNSLLAITFAGSVLTSAPQPGATQHVRRHGRLAVLVAAILLAAGWLFTFWHLGTNQNLKTQIFYRTTQARQSLKALQWMLDMDRDGYSSLLDGGDVNDSRADISPGNLEVIEDGIDNNGLAGDLHLSDVSAWKESHSALQPSSDTASPDPAAPDPAARRLNLIYIFIDTVRADHLSTYGYKRDTTPNIDKLASRSVVFENAFTPSPRTADALPKFMQSSYWDARLDSWTEVLSDNGYNTMLFPGRRSWQRYKKWMKVAPHAQGKPLKENIDLVIDTLGKAGNDRPFCAYVYVPDPHKPYIKHNEFNFGDSQTDLYDGELSYTDHHLGRLFDWLTTSGRIDDTCVVIMSDHGESLGERGVYLHATQLYNEQTHIPVIFYVPGIAPARVQSYVSSIDLGTTILGLLDLECPAGYAGASLLPLMRGREMNRLPIYGEQTGQEISPHVKFEQQVHPDTKKYMVITQDGFKLIYNREANSFELFDLKGDPGEQRNLFNSRPDKATEMRALLTRFVDIVTALRPPDADEGRYSRAGGDDGDKVEQ
jgi:arylsulfatase A-like enzyme